MQHRFRFHAAYEASLQLWSFSGDEYFHAKKVLRLGAGDLVEVFDGKGLWGEGVITAMEKDRALVQVAKTHKEEGPNPKLVIALGALQPQTMADLLPSIVELGADELHVFLHSGVAKARLNEKSLDRWNKIAIGAAKQSKRAWSPTIRTWASLEDFLAMAQKNCDAMWFLDPDAPTHLLDVGLEEKKAVCLLIGSEKGLEQVERDLVQAAHFQGANLGPSILRAFTAVLSATALISAKRSSRRKL